MKKQKILAVFPDGTGIRNYFYSNALPTNADLTLYHNFSEDTIATLQTHRPFTSVTIPVYSESLHERFLRELICFSRLRFNANEVQNPTILQTWNRNQKGVLKKALYRLIEFIASFINTYKNILELEVLYSKAIRKNKFYNLNCEFLLQMKPDVVFCAHQRGYKMPVIFAAANDLNIATETVIYSWDNLPKARLALRASRYYLWSDHMKAEMETFYPEIANDQLIVAGTPQFDFYSDPSNIIDQQKFYADYNLDPTRRIICFSGDDVLTSPDDPKYLFDLANEIKKAGLENVYQILLRRCPVDFSGRYDAVCKQFPDLIREAAPLWTRNNSEGWSGIYPLLSDVPLLVSTVYYSVCVVNVGSTMAFDFAQFDKPCLFINYDQRQKHDASWSVSHIYNFQHFRTIGDLNPVGWVNKATDYVTLIEDAVNFPKTVGPDRHKWFQKIVDVDATNGIGQRN